MAVNPDPAEQDLAAPGDLVLSPERRALLAPKLAALLAELAKLEALEGPDLEPDTAAPWGPDADEALEPDPGAVATGGAR